MEPGSDEPGAPPVLLPLIEHAALRDKDDGVRQTALGMLGECPQRGAIPILRKAMKTETDPETQLVIATSLAFNGVQDKQILDRVFAGVTGGGTSCTCVSDRESPLHPLIAARYDPVVPLLAAMAERRSESASTRSSDLKAIEQALKHIGTPKALAALEEVIKLRKSAEQAERRRKADNPGQD